MRTAILTLKVSEESYQKLARQAGFCASYVVSGDHVIVSLPMVDDHILGRLNIFVMSLLSGGYTTFKLEFNRGY